MLCREFGGELVVGEERFAVRVSFALSLRDLAEGEPETQREAALQMRLGLPDSSLLVVGGLFTRKGLAEVAGMLRELSAGRRQTAYVEEVDYIHFDMQIDRLPGDEAHVVARGMFAAPLEGTHVAQQWQGAVSCRADPHPVVTLAGLVLARSDVGELASLVQRFLDQVGDALPEESPYD